MQGVEGFEILEDGVYLHDVLVAPGTGQHEGGAPIVVAGVRVLPLMQHLHASTASLLTTFPLLRAGRLVNHGMSETPQAAHARVCWHWTSPMSHCRASQTIPHLSHSVVIAVGCSIHEGGHALTVLASCALAHDVPRAHEAGNRLHMTSSLSVAGCGSCKIVYNH